MKRSVIFSIIFISTLYVNDKLVDACETGTAFTYVNEGLVERFAKEYSSNRNALLNMMTGNWFYHLKDLDNSELYNLCECVLTKLQGNGTVIVKGYEMTTSLYSDIDFSFNNSSIRNIPLLRCSVSKGEYYLVEGYRGNGIKNAYDVYAFITQKNKPNDPFFVPKFIGVVTSVNFKKINELNEIVFVDQ